MKIIKILGTILIIFSFSESVFTYSGGAPTGHTGAPGEVDCSSCHSGNANSGLGSINISISGNPTDYVPGQTYQVTVSVNDSFSTELGFQATVVEDMTSQGAGILSVGTFNQVSISTSGGKYYANHDGSTGTIQLGRSWTFNWIAPAAGTGSITFYAAGNASNNNGSSSGDEIYTGSLSLTEFSNSGSPAIFATKLTGCQGDTILLQQSSTQNVQWYYNGINTFQSNSTFEATQTGVYYAINSNGDTSNQLSLFFNSRTTVLSRPSSITGELNPCGYLGNGLLLTYSTPPIPNADSYTWVLTNGITAVGRTDSNVITVTYPSGFTMGQIRVTPSNGCGPGLSRAIYPKLSPISTLPVFTQSVNSVCNIRGTSNLATYSILPIAGCSSYLWTLPSNTTLVSGQGTTSIQVRVGSSFTSGNISVTGISSCGNSPTKSIGVSLLSKPIISGSNVICPGDLVTYSIPTVPGAIRYRFSLPSGLTLVSQSGNSAVITNNGSFISGKVSAQVQTTLCGWSQPGTFSLNTAACRSSLDGFSLSLYPNPTSGELQLQFGVAMKHVQVSVFGSDGRLMKREVFGGVASQNLNYRGLAEGLYHVEVLATDAENNVHRRMEKVLIQR